MNKLILCLSKNILYEDKEREREAEKTQKTNVCFTTEIWLKAREDWESELTNVSQPFNNSLEVCGNISTDCLRKPAMRAFFKSATLLGVPHTWTLQSTNLNNSEKTVSELYGFAGKNTKMNISCHSHANNFSGLGVISSSQQDCVGPWCTAAHLHVDCCCFRIWYHKYTRY